MASDMARRTWDTVQLARAAGKDYKTIDRFLRGERQTTKTAGAIAKAFGKDVSRYLVGVDRGQAVA